MDDVLAMATADAEQEAPAPEDVMKRIQHFADKVKTLTKDIANLENQLSLKKEQKRRIEEQDLPETMDMVQMKEFTLEDGTKMKVKPFYAASIPEERKDEAFDWLKLNDFDGMIKADIKVQFGKGEFELAQEFLTYVRGWNQKSIEPDYKEHVHWQTLRKFVQEQIEGGKPLPIDLFGVFIGRKAEMKEPK